MGWRSRSSARLSTPRAMLIWVAASFRGSKEAIGASKGNTSEYTIALKLFTGCTFKVTYTSRCVQVPFDLLLNEESLSWIVRLTLVLRQALQIVSVAVER
jgi:hypothetical protein